MIFSNCSTFVALLLLSSSLHQTVVVQVVHAQNNWNGRATPVTCSICRDANRPILNPTHSFTMNNGNTWTCDYLQETVQDVDANASYESEALMCDQAQLAGEIGGCECGGSTAAMAVPTTTQDELNQNPSCDLCAGQASSVVPSSNYDITVTTEEVGAQNCKGLYDSMQGGIIDSSSCSRVQQEAGSTCCSTTSSSGSSSDFSQPITGTSNNNSNDVNISDDNDSLLIPVVTPSPATTVTNSNDLNISDDTDSLLVPVTPSPATTVNAQTAERTDCVICAPPIKPDKDTLAPGLSAECEASDERILAIIASDSACGRSWDAFCIVKYNDCYNDACGASQQDLVDSIALTGGPGTPPRPLSRDQVLSTCDAPLPTPRPTLPATPPPSQSGATILPTPCIPEVYGDCYVDCLADLGLSTAFCIDYCANGGGGNYGGKGGKGGKGGGVCGAKGGKGGNKGSKGGDGYGGKGSKGGDGYGGKGGKGGNKGGKSGYYQDDCCVLAGYGAKGGKGGKGVYTDYGSKGGKAGYTDYGGAGGFSARGYGTKGGSGSADGPPVGAAFGQAVNNFITNQNVNVVQEEPFFFESF